jgi:long-subunit acyl-CoA synthetase (AMP-forming)
VENIYLKGDLLAEVFIHGESTETFVLAIVVPHRKALEGLAASKGIEGAY